MIENENEYLFAVWLRQGIMDLIAGVRDAKNYGWDDTSPNWLTAQKVADFIEAIDGRLQTLGFLYTYEFADCGFPGHELIAAGSFISPGYWVPVRADGLEAVFEHDAHDAVGSVRKMDGIEMDFLEVAQSVGKFKCPCNPKGGKKNISRAILAIWPSGSRSRMRTFLEVREYVSCAHQRSGDHLTRAGVREKLLQSLVVLNEAIAPISAQDHILRGREKRLSVV